MLDLTTDLRQETASNDKFKHAFTKNHSWAPFAYLTDMFLSLFSLHIQGFVTNDIDQSLYEL